MFFCMLRNAILLVLILTAGLGVSAQVKKKIKRGRRNKSESQFTLDEGFFQAEWEVGHETLTGKLNTTVYPNLALRYGITKQFEVNAEISLLTAHDETSAVINTTGIEPVSFGCNYLLSPESKKWPAIILSGQLAIPFLATKKFTATYLAPTLQVVVAKAVNSKLVLSASNGIFWDGFSTRGIYIYNGTVSYNLTPKWTATSEWFGFVNSTSPQHNTDVSLAYALNKKVQFGVTAGTGLSKAAHKSYFALNGVWGCSLKHKKVPAAGNVPL